MEKNRNPSPSLAFRAPVPLPLAGAEHQRRAIKTIPGSPAGRSPGSGWQAPGDIERTPTLLYITAIQCYTCPHPQSL